MKNRFNVLLAIAGSCLTIFFILFFKPIINTGDAPVYIKYARLIAEGGDTGALLHRSPLYPFLLSLIIKVEGVEALPEVVLAIQYILIFLSCVVLFIILNYILTRKQSITAAILFFLSLSTIYYGYMILTEILTVFLFILCTWVLVKWISRRSNNNLIILGVLTSLLILARFNTLPIIISFLFLIGYHSITSDKIKSSSGTLKNLIFFLIPVIIILNLYAFNNYRKHDFYGLFPTGGSAFVSRNAILMTIDGTESISDINRPVYDIFIKAVDDYKSRPRVKKKDGSLIKIRDTGLNEKIYGGFQIYSIAFPSLCSYYNIDPGKPEPALSGELRSFYSEVVSENRGRIIMMRIYSMLNSFRSSSGVTMNGFEHTNLGNFPGWVIIFYKITMILMSFFTFIATFIYCIYSILKSESINPFLLSLIILFLSFYFVNFLFAATGDSNRFKFPSDPIMFGLFIFYMAEIKRLIIDKLRIRRKLFFI